MIQAQTRCPYWGQAGIGCFLECEMATVAQQRNHQIFETFEYAKSIIWEVQLLKFKSNFISDE
mgnify:CR=1 FL=1